MYLPACISCWHSKLLLQWLDSSLTFKLEGNFSEICHKVLNVTSELCMTTHRVNQMGNLHHRLNLPLWLLQDANNLCTNTHRQTVYHFGSSTKIVFIYKADTEFAVVLGV